MSFILKLEEKFGKDSFTESEFRHNRRAIVDAAKVHDFLTFLKEECGFDMLADLTAVDYLNYPDATDRYGLIYVLTNTSTGERAFIKTHLNDPDPTVKSVYPLWRGADWMEREMYDMYGITFEGHPDLRRILLPEEFVSYPLRKDYPLRGRGERHNFEYIPRSEG